MAGGHSPPEVERKRAAKALARFMSLHPHNTARKTGVVVRRSRRYTAHRIGGPKACRLPASAWTLCGIREPTTNTVHLNKKSRDDSRLSRPDSLRHELSEQHWAYDKCIPDKGHANVRAQVCDDAVRNHSLQRAGAGARDDFACALLQQLKELVGGRMDRKGCGPASCRERAVPRG